MLTRCSPAVQARRAAASAPATSRVQPLRRLRRWPAAAAAPQEPQEGEPGPGPSSQQQQQQPQQPQQQQGSVKEFSAYTSVDEWKKLDQKVNKYPCTRSFQAIGVADADGAFQRDIVAAVEAVVGPVHVECVSARPSAGGKYVAVRVGPVHVLSADQVVDVFARIKEAGGDRLKWYM